MLQFFAEFVCIHSFCQSYFSNHYLPLRQSRDPLHNKKLAQFFIIPILTYQKERPCPLSPLYHLFIMSQLSQRLTA